VKQYLVKAKSLTEALEEVIAPPHVYLFVASLTGALEEALDAPPHCIYLSPGCYRVVFVPFPFVDTGGGRAPPHGENTGGGRASPHSEDTEGGRASRVDTGGDRPPLHGGAEAAAPTCPICTTPLREIACRLPGCQRE